MCTYPPTTIDFGELTHSVDDLFGTDETFSNMIGDPPTSGEMLKPDNCEGNCQSSQGGNGPSQMTNQLPPNGGDQELQPGTSSSKEVMIVYPGADMHTLDTHQDCQNSNPSNKNKAPRRKSTFFTIKEDEALVQAVLRHGTGRWKMIKDEAFGNDSRRTHTDLRDKWRSLVKTANLPAHKRRGVAPSEELLEMVRHVDQNGTHQQAMHAAP